MRRITLALLFAFFGGVALGAPHDTEPLENDFMNATTLLYGQDESGSMKMLCTATAFEREGKVYHFAAAAHCVSEDDTDHERVQMHQMSWFITFDDLKDKNFVSAKVLGVGYQHRGDDFAVFEVVIEKRAVPIMPLAENPHLGEVIVNIASPLGLGKQLFRGHVSMEHLNRPLIQDSINWKGAALLQMSVGPGSSGSAVVSLRQKGIVAFLVGELSQQRGSPNIVAIPVEKFKKFWTDVKAKKYKWYREEDAESSQKK